MGIHGDRQKKLTPEKKKTFDEEFDRIFGKKDKKDAGTDNNRGNSTD